MQPEGWIKMAPTEDQWIERRKQMRAFAKQGAGFIPLPHVLGGPFELMLSTPQGAERIRGCSWDDVTEQAITRAGELMGQRRAA